MAVKRPVMALSGAFLLSSILAACGGSDNAGGGSNVAVQGGGDTPALLCNDKSWYGGVTELCQGKLVYKDYVYDDFGADAGPLSPAPSLLNLNTRGGQIGSPFANTPGLLSPAAGDSKYPEGSESTADLVKLTLAIDGNELVATFELNALYEPNQTIAAIAVDTDNDPATSTETLLGLTVQGADVVYEFNQGNVDTNVIEGRFPLPEGDAFRVWAVTAQATGQVMNVAFRGVDEQAGATGGVPDQFLPEKGNWWEDKQAAALAQGDISDFVASVDVPAMLAGDTKPANVGAGFRQRVYTSDYTVPNSTGEGMTLTGVVGREGLDNEFCGQTFHLVGKYLPYGVYLPKSVDPSQPASLMVLMHGCEANHASQVNQPGMQTQFGENLQRIIVSPSGRGPYGFYSDISERDVLDVLADAKSTFNVDEDRVFVGGYSMGGYGAARFAALYPDQFAGVSNWVGFTGSIVNTPLPGNPLVAGENQLRAATGGALPLDSRAGAVGNIIDYLGNLRHVPGSHSYAALDELVQVNTGLAWAAKLQESVAVPYEFYMYLTAEHLTLIALDEWGNEADNVADLTRVTNPPHITFRTNEAFAFPEYDIKHDKAYWLSGIAAREAGDAVLDMHSLGCTDQAPQFEEGQMPGNGPVPYVQTYRRVLDLATIQTAQNVVSGSLENVAEVALDMAGACLTDGARYSISTDGPTTITLSNGSTLSLVAGLNEGEL